MYYTRVFPIDVRDPEAGDAIAAWIEDIRQQGQLRRFAVGTLHTVPIAPVEPVPPCDRPMPGVLCILTTTPF